jgi:hypothetical protein
MVQDCFLRAGSWLLASTSAQSANRISRIELPFPLRFCPLNKRRINRSKAPGQPIPGARQHGVNWGVDS